MTERHPPADAAADAAPADARAADAMAADLAQAQSDRNLAQLQGDLEAARLDVLRAQAELENFRKRMRREQEQELRYAALPLMSDLLPVVDNLERALAAAGQNEAAGGLVDGVRMVAEQLLGVLERHDCRRIAAVGAAFDPHLHQAIAQQPSDEHPAGVVVIEAQAGYQLHDRVVRPAQVIVSLGSAAASSPGE